MQKQIIYLTIFAWAQKVNGSLIMTDFSIFVAFLHIYFLVSTEALNFEMKISEFSVLNFWIKMFYFPHNEYDTIDSAKSYVTPLWFLFISVK